MRRPIIDVNFAGLTDGAGDTTLVAADEQVRLGHVINLPILARYPDGTIRDGNLVCITSAGLAWLRENLSSVTGNVTSDRRPDDPDSSR